jgi:type II secretory pathway component GspD/PulD (secretin)
MKKITNQFLVYSSFFLSLCCFFVLSCERIVLAQELGVEPTTIESELAKDILGTSKKEEKERKSRAKKVEEPLITFSARNISTKDAFATLARISGRSISVSSDVRDDETIAVVEIQDQTFEEAFFSLIDASRANYTTTGNTYTVIKGSPATPIRVFALGAAAVDKSLPILERTADISYDNQDLATLLKDLANKYGIDIVLTATPTERVSCRVREINIEEALRLVLSGTSFDFTTVGEGSETYVIYNRLNKNYTVGLESKMFPLMNLEAMDIQALLPVEVRANVRISNDQNSLIADGSPNDLKRIEEFLQRIDKPLPQVELELKLIEVQKRATEILSAFKESGFLIGKISKGLTIFDFSPDLWKIFNQQLSYLEKVGLAQVRAYPKLVSLSGRTAMINIDQDTNLVLGAATGQGQQIGVVATQQLQRITAGTALSITPIVGTGGLITAKIQIEVSDNSGTTTQNQVTVPATTTRRRINADVQVRDGETVAIGGLIIDNNSLDRVGLPFLTRMPFIGNLISNRNRQRSQSELIVLITPRIRNIPEEESVASNEETNVTTDAPEG